MTPITFGNTFDDTREVPGVLDPDGSLYLREAQDKLCSAGIKKVVESVTSAGTDVPYSAAATLSKSDMELLFDPAVTAEDTYVFRPVGKVMADSVEFSEGSRTERKDGGGMSKTYAKFQNFKATLTQVKTTDDEKYAEMEKLKKIDICLKKKNQLVFYPGLYNPSFSDSHKHSVSGILTKDMKAESQIQLGDKIRSSYIIDKPTS